MENGELISSLVKLGMTEREAKLYLALLSKHTASAVELQNLTGLRQNIVYENIGNLVRQGYCSEKRVGSRRTFCAFDPRRTLDLHVKRFETELEQIKNIKDELQIELQTIYAEVDEVKEPYEYIELIRGNENIQQKYLKLLESANSEMLNFTRPPYASTTKAMYAQQLIGLEKLIKKGGKIRGVFEINASSPPRTFYVCEQSYLLGEDFRIAPKLPLKLFIFDQKTLLIMADKSSLAGESELSATVIKQKTTAEGYIALFEFVWDQAHDYLDWKKDNEELMARKLDEYEKSAP